MVALAIFLFQKLIKPPISQKEISLSVPTKIPSPPSMIKDVQLVLRRDVKDLHWFNQQELAYTFFDSATKQRVLAKTNGNQETILLQAPQIKMSEVYWARTNDLLIFDYGYPYEVYLFTNAGILKNLNLNGYAFTWSPDGSSLFFLEINEKGQEVAKVYNLRLDSKSTIPISLTPFQASFWSPTKEEILLYSFNLETGAGALNLFNLTNNSVRKVSTRSILFPSWSPSGDRVVYVAEGGLYTYSNSEGERIIYQTKTILQYISYGWLNSDEIIVFDAGQIPSRFLRVSLKTKIQLATLSDLRLASEQRVAIRLSPSQEIIAIASEKDGLWFVRNR